MKVFNLKDKNFMAATHLVSTNRWVQEVFQKIKCPKKKLVLDILCSNPHSSRSGIFKIMSGTLMDYYGCGVEDPKEVKSIVLELKEDGIIDYDPDSHIVYIPSFLDNVPFGLSATIIASELLKETQMYPIKRFWQQFFVKEKTKILEYFSKAESESKKPHLIKNNPNINKIKVFLENPTLL